jgi:hypothetical protein
MCIKLKWHLKSTCRNEKGQQKTSQDRKKLEQLVCGTNGFQKMLSQSAYINYQLSHHTPYGGVVLGFIV